MLKRRALKGLCVLLVLAMGPGGAAWAEENDGSAMEMAGQRYLVSGAELPVIPMNPDLLPGGEENIDDPAYVEALETWWDAREALDGAQIPNIEALRRFSMDSARVFLGDEAAENGVYSPVSLWLCLNLLAQLSSGDSRAQVLSALGAASLEEQAEQAQALFRGLYWDDGVSACLPGVSLWLDAGLETRPGVPEALSRDQHASVFQGSMGSADYDAALRDWLNRQTRGLLSDRVEALRFDPSTVLAVCATLYLKAGWASPFSVENTAEGVFHGAGSDARVQFMHSDMYGSVYQGEGFSAVILGLREGGWVSFLLPAEGDPRALLADEEAALFLAEGRDWQPARSGLVHLSVPRLDCSAVMALRPGLERMGIRDLFLPEAADFSGAFDADGPAYLTGVEQCARLSMDEAGVEAAAITMTSVLGALVPEEELDFTLDRPFMLVVSEGHGLPLFMGMIEQL